MVQFQVAVHNALMVFLQIHCIVDIYGPLLVKGTYKQTKTTKRHDTILDCVCWCVCGGRGGEIRFPRAHRTKHAVHNKNTRYYCFRGQVPSAKSISPHTFHSATDTEIQLQLQRYRYCYSYRYMRSFR